MCYSQYAISLHHHVKYLELMFAAAVPELSNLKASIAC